MNPTIENGFVYLISPQSSGLHKIGYTSVSIEKRIAQLQTGSATPLHLVRFWVGTQGHEAALHRKLARYRKQGEWFRFPKIVVRELELLEVLDVDAIRLPDYTNEAQCSPIINIKVAAGELAEISDGDTQKIAKEVEQFAREHYWTKEADIDPAFLSDAVASLRLMGLKGREQKRFARIENSFKCFLHWRDMEIRWYAKFGRPTFRAAMRENISNAMTFTETGGAQ